ncbi:MAG: GlcNAc-transferase family protein, partial [Burkholderiaceae bacterium]
QCSLRLLQPSPPTLPELPVHSNETIFISIAAYCDPLLPYTVHGAYTMAAHPERLRFGIIDQAPPTQRLRVTNALLQQKIRYEYMHPLAARGACWARALAMKLYRDEDWFFQIDSHMMFMPGWDERLIDSAKQCQQINPKCIVSSYPNPFEVVGEQAVAKPTTTKVLAHVVAQGMEFNPDNPVLSFYAVPVEQDEPVRGFHLGAGCLFAPGSLVAQVPYDPHLYFHGEEQAIAARAYTHGWDIFHTSDLPIYHLYTTPANAKPRPLHWSEEQDQLRQQRWWELNEASNRRLQALLCDGADLGEFGLGTVRTLADYAAFSGIDYARRTLGPRARLGPWAQAAIAAAEAASSAPQSPAAPGALGAVQAEAGAGESAQTDAKAVFTSIFSHNTWGDAESVSGAGSTQHATRHVRRELEGLFAEYRIRSLLDLPCGDFNWMQLVNLHGIDYTGGDVVEPLIARNTARYARPGVRFEVMDLLTSDLPQADLVLCRDCLLHLPFADITLALANIKRSGARYLLTTSFTWRHMGPNLDIPLGHWRRLNLQQPPLTLPPPLLTMVEACLGENSEDKSLLLFAVADLPG